MLGFRYAMAAALALAGCGDDHSNHTADAGAHDHDAGADPDVTASDVPFDPDARGSVEVRFAAKVGDRPFRCGTVYEGLGTTGARWNPLDFRLYVHDVRLVTADGREAPLALVQDGTFQHRNLALLDFEDRTGACANGNALTNAVVRGALPAGVTGPFTGVRFRLGVPFDLNHGNAATEPSPLNLTSLWWSWQGGHKFLRLDGRVEDASGAVRVATWNIHVGSTGCNGSAMGGVTACSSPNRADIELTGFDPARNTVVADLARLLEGTDVATTAMPSPGCMSTPDDRDCARVFPNLGIPFGAAQGAQTFFRVE